MLGAVQDAAGEKLWATTGAFGYHWVAVGASGVVRKQRGLAQKGEVSTNYHGWRKPISAACITKSRWLTNVLSWPIAPGRWSNCVESQQWNAFCVRCSAAELRG